MSIQLAPDLEEALVSEATARGVDVDALVREALKLYHDRYEKRPPLTRRVPYVPRDAEMAWTANPDPAYIGQWVALRGDRVVANGPDGKQVYQSARSQGINEPFMFFVSEPDPRPLFVGWLGVE